MTRSPSPIRPTLGDDDEIFTDAPWSFALQVLLETLLPARRDLLVDPLLAEPWSCDPERCRPLLGPNLCCKVETRCAHLIGEVCAVHETKPFSCALFPLDLIRVNGIRVVTTPKNELFFQTGWSRYDQDMLRCFEGTRREATTLFSSQRAILLRAFTLSEVRRMEQVLGLPDPGGGA
ncbi:MAG: hypothetical protein SCH98_08935 [Deferrisomatales bacterium]|nr:hypothetical protein [Deferrisomatales bacterium]